MKARADESPQESQIIRLIFLGLFLPSVGLVMGGVLLPTIMWSFARETGSPLLGIVVMTVFGAIGLFVGTATYLTIFFPWMAN